jgi:hypothetical protein
MTINGAEEALDGLEGGDLALTGEDGGEVIGGLGGYNSGGGGGDDSGGLRRTEPLHHAAEQLRGQHQGHHG